MKFYVISDVHERFHCMKFLELGAIEADYVLYLGDIINTLNSFELLRKHLDKVLTHYKVIYIPGNHEYYKSSIKQTEDLFKQIKHDNFQFLNNGIIHFPEFVLFGACMWSLLSRRRKMSVFNAKKHNSLHKQSMNILEHVLKTSKKPVVIATHFPLTYKADTIFSSPNEYYHTDYGYLPTHPKVKKMLYGHTHFNYRNGNIYGNCMGRQEENTGWDMETIEL